MKKAAKLTNGDLVEIIQMRGINSGEPADDPAALAPDAAVGGAAMPSGAPVPDQHPPPHFDLLGLAFAAPAADAPAAEPADPVEKALCFA
jgi:hypothetical protein